MDPIASSSTIETSSAATKPPGPSAFVASFNTLAADIHEVNRSKGWWDDELVLPDKVEGYLRAAGADEAFIQQIRAKVMRNDGEALMLVVTEVAEAMEGLRHQNPPDDKVPAFSAAEAECADVVIRLMDLCHARGWRLAEAIEAKVAFNQTRPFKHGGKSC